MLDLTLLKSFSSLHLSVWILSSKMQLLSVSVDVVGVEVNEDDVGRMRRDSSSAITTP